MKNTSLFPNLIPMFRVSLVLVFISIFLVPATSQHLNNVKFSKEEIHLYEGVTGMYEDAKGYLWIYGKDGISRYDGFIWERIEDIYPETKYLPSRGCTALASDEHFLWVGVANVGLHAIDKAGRLQYFDQLVRGEMNTISGDVRQLVSKVGKLFVVDDKGLKAYERSGGKYEKIDIKNLDAESVKEIFLHEESLWIENETGLQRLNIETLEITLSENLYSISFFVHPDGDLWIASIGEGTLLQRFDTATATFNAGSFQPYDNYKKKRGYAWLSSSELLSTPLLDVFLEILSFDNESTERIDKELSDLGKETRIKRPITDSNGRTWVFGRELYMIPPQHVVDQHFISKELGIVNDMLVTDDFSYISIKDKGLYKYTRDGKLLRSYTVGDSELADNNIISIEPFGNKGVGLIMRNYFQVLTKNDILEAPYFFEGRISTTKDNYDYTHVWIGASSCFLKVDLAQGKSEKLYVDGKRNLVEKSTLPGRENLRSYLHIISAEGSLMPNHFRGSGTDLVANLAGRLFSMGKSSRLQDIRIAPSGSRSLTATDDGLYLGLDSFHLWSGSTNMMMTMKAIYNKPDPVRIKTTDSYFTNAVFYNDSIVYATSRDRIYRIALDSMEIETFGRLHGTVNNEYTARASFKDKDGRIYFGGDVGIDVVDEKAYQKATNLGTLEVDQISHNGLPQMLTQGDKHHIASDVKIVEIKVNMPKNQIGDFMRIQGRIDDSGWTDLSEDHTMSIFTPSPGSHNVSFRGIDKNDMVRTEVHELKLQVQRIWYKQVWLWVILGTLALWAIFTARTRRDKKRSEKAIRDAHLQEEMASLKLTSLNSQMNPHFIFNALSSIQQLITSGETQIAEDYLSKFSKLLRHVILYASHKNVKLTEELEFIENYLELELLRFENAFEYKIENLVENPDQVDIPPFFIQPQVENAIKHGFVKHEKANLLKIKLEEIEDRIVITIEDNGQGRELAQARNIYASSGTKKGNLLTEERIENLNKLNYESTYEVKDLTKDGVPCGTSVKLGFKKAKVS